MRMQVHNFVDFSIKDVEYPFARPLSDFRFASARFRMVQFISLKSLFENYIFLINF